jgi:ribose transport system substrate-binding protein
MHQGGSFMPASRLASILAAFLSLSGVAVSPAALAQPAPSGLSTADAAVLQQAIQSHMGETHFTASAEAIDPSALKGKLIFTIPLSTSDPWCGVVDQQMTDFAKRLGIRFEVWQNTGQLPQWVQGFDTAINHKADLINVVCGLNPGVVSPQIQAAKKAGIPVMAGHTYAIGQPTLPDLAGVVYGAYIDAAKLESDWVILQTHGKADVLVITSPSTPNSPFIQKTIESEFGKYCSGCKVRFVGVNVSDWSTKIGPQVRNAILADHELNYVIPIYDSMSQFVVPAITATGTTDRVHVATFNALPAVLDMIRTGKTVTFDVGEDTGWLAGSILDQDMRILLQKPLVENSAAALRIFTKDNVAEAGVPAKYGRGYGGSAVAGYENLWGLK